MGKPPLLEETVILGDMGEDTILVEVMPGETVAMITFDYCGFTANNVTIIMDADEEQLAAIIKALTKAKKVLRGIRDMKGR